MLHFFNAFYLFFFAFLFTERESFIFDGGVFSLSKFDGQGPLNCGIAHNIDS